MNNQKNFILAVVLSGAFLLIWQLVVMPKFAPQTQPAPVSTTVTPDAGTEPTSSIQAPWPKQPSTVPAKDVTIRVGDHELVVTPLGGAVRHWRIASKSQELDLVEFPEDAHLPLASFENTAFSITPKANAIEMGATVQNGVRVVKTIALQPNDYLHDVTYVFKNPTAQPVSLEWTWGWGPGLGTVASEEKENAGLTRALLFKKFKAQDLKPDTYPEMGQWAGIDNRYYLVAFLPKQNPSHPDWIVEGTKGVTRVSLKEKLTIAPGASQTVSYRLYVGPKGYTHLRRYHENLEAAISFGWFTWIGKGVLRVLYFFHNLTGNYGWAIVCLTVLLQIILLPLSLKSFRSMQAMKRLQPMIAELQAKYKEDPKRLNIEMMNLYKKSGTNPFGGCFVMLLQMPIFVALFNTLRNAYELRGAPFMGWIHDLSVHDPYYILPVVMGGSMFLQQRLSGAVSDPTQRQMMLMMPAIFTFMFLHFPSGVVVYWLVNNVLTIIFQFVFLKMHESDPPTLRVVR